MNRLYWFVANSKVLQVVMLLTISITFILEANSATLSEKSVTSGQIISLFDAVDLKVPSGFYISNEFIYQYGIYSNVIYRTDGMIVGTIENGHNYSVNKEIFLNLINSSKPGVKGNEYDSLKVRCNTEDLIKITNPQILSYCYDYGREIFRDNPDEVLYSLMTMMEFNNGKTIIINFVVPTYWDEINFREVESIINNMTSH